MTTIYDIAKEAGVTATTVSNVLRGKGSVSEKTRARILKIAQERGYRPNLVARSLIEGRTGVIALVVPSVSNPFFADIVAETERRAFSAGLSVFVSSLATDNKQEAQALLYNLAAHQVEGIIVQAGSIPISTFRTLHIEIPIVFCLPENDVIQNAYPIEFDFMQAGRLAAQHLFSLGHRRMGIIIHTKTLSVLNRPTRLVGFQEEISALGGTIDPRHIFFGDSSIASGKEAAQALLRQPEPPTAIFATNDAMAIGVLSVAWELGIRVPQDLSIIGLDDIEIATYTTPPLTSIRLDRSTIIARALEVILQQREGQTVTQYPPLAPSLVIRQSTAPPSKSALPQISTIAD